MKRSLGLWLAGIFLLPLGAAAQNAQPIKAADERFKADILVVVAHPDDEAAVTPYLARAIYDEHKRVAVVFATRGGSGANEYRRETGPALAEAREQEARQACAALGITNVWFLDGKDTASQNVLNSLANWGDGKNLEEMIRLVRLTRPEVILTWLPGIFIGENHGDHQASGVLATEAFDLAADPTAFPAQIAGASKRLEPYLESLSPWQPKKIYYFSDADDQKQFAGTGPAYSIKEISPLQKKPYWRIALAAATPHLTQFPGQIQQLSKISEEQLAKMMDDPNKAWWSDPLTLIFGKSRVKGDPKADVFQGIAPAVQQRATIDCREQFMDIVDPPPVARVFLGGPWSFYPAFYSKHCLQIPAANVPEIGIKAGDTFTLPLIFHLEKPQELDVNVAVDIPEGWKIKRGTGPVRLPAEKISFLNVEIETPAFSPGDLKKATAANLSVRIDVAGKTLETLRLKVQLQTGGLSQN